MSNPVTLGQQAEKGLGVLVFCNTRRCGHPPGWPSSRSWSGWGRPTRCPRCADTVAAPCAMGRTLRPGQSSRPFPAQWPLA